MGIWEHLSTLIDQAADQVQQIANSAQQQLMAFQTDGKFNFPKVRRDDQVSQVSFGVEVCYWQHIYLL